MQLAIIQRDLAGVRDDDPGIIGVAVRVELHQRKAAPHVVLHAGAAECRDLRSVEPAHDVRIGVHRQAVQRVFGEDDEIQRRHAALGLADQPDDLLGLPGELGRGGDHWQLQLDEPDHHAIGRLVQSA